MNFENPTMLAWITAGIIVVIVFILYIPRALAQRRVLRQLFALGMPNYKERSFNIMTPPFGLLSSGTLVLAEQELVIIQGRQASTERIEYPQIKGVEFSKKISGGNRFGIGRTMGAEFRIHLTDGRVIRLLMQGPCSPDMANGVANAGKGVASELFGMGGAENASKALMDQNASMGISLMNTMLGLKQVPVQSLDAYQAGSAIFAPNPVTEAFEKQRISFFTWKRMAVLTVVVLAVVSAVVLIGMSRDSKSDNTSTGSSSSTYDGSLADMTDEEFEEYLRSFDSEDAIVGAEDVNKPEPSSSTNRSQHEVAINQTITDDYYGHVYTFHKAIKYAPHKDSLDRATVFVEVTMQGGKTTASDSYITLLDSKNASTITLGAALADSAEQAGISPLLINQMARPGETKKGYLSFLVNLDRMDNLTLRYTRFEIKDGATTIPRKVFEVKIPQS